MTMIATALLLFSLFTVPAESGLWQLSVPEDPEMVFYLFADGETDPTLYDSAWRPRYLDEVKMEGNEMYLRTVPTSNLQMFQFELTLAGKTATGSMKSRIMQYEIVKELEGVRISPKLPELPEQAMDRVRKEGPVGLARALSRQAADRSLAEFKEYWSAEFFSDYYVVIAPLFSKQRIDPANEEKFVEEVYEQVKGWNIESCLPASENVFLPKEGEEADEETSDSSSEVIVKLPSALVREEMSFTFATFRNVDRCCSQPEFLTEQIHLLPLRCEEKRASELNAR